MTVSWAARSLNAQGLHGGIQPGPTLGGAGGTKGRVPAVLPKQGQGQRVGTGQRR